MMSDFTGGEVRGFKILDPPKWYIRMYKSDIRGIGSLKMTPKNRTSFMSVRAGYVMGPHYGVVHK